MVSVRISFKASWVTVACLSAALPGCAVHKGPNGESALWSTTKKSSTSAKDLKDPVALNLAYARWQEQLGQINDARQAYEFVLTDDPKSTDAILGLARLDQLAGRSQHAEAGIQKALKMKPDDPHVLHSAGQFYAAKNDWSKATELLSKAMAADSDNDAYRYSYAVALARSGRIEESVPHFVATVGDASAQYNIGYILYQQGRLAEAEQQLAQAVTKRPELKQAKVVLEQVRKARKEGTMLAATPNRSARTAVANSDAAVMRGDAMPLRQAVQQTSGVRQPFSQPARDDARETLPDDAYQTPTHPATAQHWYDDK